MTEPLANAVAVFVTETGAPLGRLINVAAVGSKAGPVIVSLKPAASGVTTAV